MVEAINMWKRSHDDKWSVCILVNVGIFKEQQLMQRYKETFDTLLECWKYAVEIRRQHGGD